MKVDEGIYKEALEKWSPKLKFADRVGYGNLLLLADKGAEAERLNRELYAGQHAGGVGGGDGGDCQVVAGGGWGMPRANAFLTKMAEHNATQPSGLPSAGGGAPAATEPGGLP